jgi:Leucine-rich repeat (LRR) protein
MSQLITLHLGPDDLMSQEPWDFLAMLTNLQVLILRVRASGDPSPLSALTELTALYLESFGEAADHPAPFSFSSLQPLSTLRQLEELRLDSHACAAATSLQGLAGLSKLNLLILDFGAYDGKLRSLEGISPGVVELLLTSAPEVVSLAGIEGCTSLEKLTLGRCGISSLQPLSGLNNMEEMEVSDCCLTSLEGLNSMAMQSLSLTTCPSLTQLSGVGHLSNLKRLILVKCGVTSLQPLSRLNEGLQRLFVFRCDEVQEEVLELPHILPPAKSAAGAR